MHHHDLSKIQNRINRQNSRKSGRDAAACDADDYGFYSSQPKPPSIANVKASS